MGKTNNTKDVTQFRINRVAEIQKMYADEASTARRYGRTTSGGRTQYDTAAKVRDLLEKSLQEKNLAVTLSQQLYAKNPIYSQLIEYLSNMYIWRYKVTPHKTYTKSKAKARKTIKEEDFMSLYRYMLEVVDGVSIETKFPLMLAKLYVDGSLYLTTVSDDDSLTMDTLLLPAKYCRKIGETQFGTAMIQFDFSYFDALGLQKDQVQDYLKSFPKEFKKGYNKYKANTTQNRWQDLDPHFSTGILLNDYGIPTFLYALGGILDYEKYQDNELERNSNLLKYIVVQTMPHYEDKLIFEMDEVQTLHNSMKKIIDQGDKARLITTFGDIKVEKISENDTAENQVLSKAFKAIFNNAGFNSGVFTGESVEALKYSLIRDKSFVWKHVQALISFYTIAINNWFDFKTYEADIDILPISWYTYNDDIKVYKDNATLGVGKIDYFIASGVKQINLEDMLELEKNLHLDRITPMQTSYTQTAEDRQEDNGGDDQTNKDGDPKEPETGIEPTEEGTEGKDVK